MMDRHTFYPDLPPFNRGRLRVSPLHEIHFEECGNPQGKRQGGKKFHRGPRKPNTPRPA